MLRELLETILKEIPDANNQEVADKISEIFKQSLPEVLEEIANEDETNQYYAEGNAGTPGMKSKDKIGYLPVVFLYDTFIKQSDRFNSDPFYILYILREDRKGIYLSLNRSQEYMKRILEEKDEWDSWYEGNLERNLIKDILFIREKLKIPESFSDVMNLGKIYSKSAKFYEAASICSKYYTLENLPNTDELLKDLQVILDFYNEVNKIDYFANGLDIQRINIEATKFLLSFQKKLKSIQNDYREFISLYPFKKNPERIDKILPDDIYNKGHPPYFLNYIEHKLTECGNVSVGQNAYAENARKKIDVFQELIKIAVDDSISISKKVDAHWEAIKYWGGDKHLAKKIIFLYNPKKVLPIYKTKHLEHFNGLVDPEFRSKSNKFKKSYDELSLGQKFEFLNEKLIEFKEKKITTEMDNVSFMHFLYHFSHPDKSIKVWCFSVNMDLNPDFKERKKAVWNSAKEVRKGDIILFYCGKPYSHIADIFIALSDPYEDEKIARDWNKPAIDICKQIVIKDPINLEEMENNDILKNWAGVKMHFGKSHFKVSDKVWAELKRCILEKNPELKDKLKTLEIGNFNKFEHIPNVFLTPSTIETNLKLKYDILEQICGTLNSKKHIMFTGAPGTGKTNLAEDVCKVAENLNFINGYVLTTATSDWTTFDTIGGYMPNEEGKLYFEEGKFLQSIRENKWLIIDEINRADIDKAFGQLFTVLSGQGVELPYKIDESPVKILRTDQNKSFYDEKNATYYVGENWRIISTMNIYDKDYLFEMSYAFMRRFTFVYIDIPIEEEFKKLIRNWSKTLREDYLLKIERLLEINKYREIGPAIFKDMIEYVEERHRIGSKNHVIEDAVLSFIMPQFEGLEKPDVLAIWNILREIFEESEMLKKRMEEISTLTLDE